MKRVLLVCYYFPPLGGAGIARPLGLFKHLPKFGWRCDILSVKQVTYRVYEPELLDGLDSDRIYRSGSTDPQRILYMLGLREVKDHTFEKGRSFAERFFPDSKVGWVRPAIRLGRTLIANNKYDMILSTSPPVSGHMVASQLAKESKIPWVADFRDFWSSHPIEHDYSGGRLIQAKKLLHDFTTTASEITSVNDSIQRYFKRGPSILNSIEGEFIKLWEDPKPDYIFKIGAVGTVNMYCPIEPLLQLLAIFREQEPELFTRIQVDYVGAMDPHTLEAQLAQYGMTDRFFYHGVQPRKETIRILNQSALFFVSMPKDEDRVFSTGRIFTMLSSGRPLLAAAPRDSEVDRLVTASLGGGCSFLPGDMDDALDYLRQAIPAHDRGEFLKPVPLSARMRYSSESMAEQFAAVFNQILQRKQVATESVPST